MHNITIRRVTNGVVVDVGCHTFAFNNITTAMQEITQYLYYPEKTQKRWKTILDSWSRMQEEAVDAPDPGFQGKETHEGAPPRPDLELIARGPFGTHIVTDTPATRRSVGDAAAYGTEVEDAPSAEGTVSGG